MSRANLRVVPKPPMCTDPKSLLRQIVPELIAAEALVARLRNMMAEQGRELAKDRGVAFIRPEQLRQEFKR